MKGLAKCGTVLVVILLLGGAAIAQKNDSGAEGKTPTAQQTTTSTRLINVLPDGDQPFITQPTSHSLPKGAVNDKSLEQASESPVVYTPLWEGLDQLSLSDKQNASIQIEVPHDLETALLNRVQKIEQLWNSGEFDQAVALLRDLEELQGLHSIAVGISWKVPKITSASKWGTDVQIGTYSDIGKVFLDFHDATGNLFAVLNRFGGDNPRFTVNISTDGGQTWQETFTWNGSLELIDVDAVVVDDYLYVGYVDGEVPDQARIRRFFASTGLDDDVYFWKTVFDNDVVIYDIALTSNADHYDNRIYYLAILTDHSLVYYYAEGSGETWYQVATGISNADHGLDACYNNDWTEWYVWASFVSTDGMPYAARKSSVGWEDIALYPAGADYATSIGAYQDRILVAFEYTGGDIYGVISFDGGDYWYLCTIAGDLYEPPYFQQAHVTGRRGGGFAVVYENEWEAEPDTCWFRYRDYGTEPSMGTYFWSEPESFNEIDVYTGTPMALEWIPPLDPACHAYGSIWIGPSPHHAYFDRIDRRPGDVNGDGIADLTDAISILNYLFREQPAPIPMWTGDANCNDEVNITDALRILNYLFTGGPPPCC